MAEANRSSILYKEEGTAGTNPAGVATYLNYTSSSLAASNEVSNSAFIRSDTNVAGTARTGVSVGGEIGTHVQFAEYDPFIEAVLRGEYSTATSITGTNLALVASGNKITDSSDGFTNIAVGHWIKISGSATAANNGWVVVTAKTNNGDITVDGITLVDDSANASLTVKSSTCVNSTTEKTFTIEQAYEDVTKYDLFTGISATSFGFTFASNAMATGSIGLLGFKQPVMSGTSGFSGSHAAASTNPIMNTVDHVSGVYVNRALSTAKFTNLDFSITTNGETLPQIGELVGGSVANRSIGVTGNFSLYFEDDTFVGYRNDFTPIDLGMNLVDADGNEYFLHFPECFIGDGAPTIQGIDTTIEESYSFNAVLDPSLLNTVSVTKIPV